MTFTFPLWACLIPSAVALVLTLLGIRYLRRGSRAAWILVGGGVVVAVVMGPMLFLDRVVVDDESITQTTGFWFAPTVKGFAFADTERVWIREERVRSVRSSRIEEFWYVLDKAGETRRINPGDLWSNNGEKIIELLRARGVDVSR